MNVRRLAPAVLGGALLAACGGGASPTETTAVPSASPTEPGSGAASDIDALEGAVFQIEVTGTFRDPEIGEHTSAGAGSGFFIDADGTAITNNHVVTGASIVKALVAGTEYPARVVAASECSDVAVIKVDGDDDFAFLDWYAGDIKPGLDIYVAGYPLGDAPFTLTDGIVSRATGVIDENWAWVANSFEHTADTNPGNSGGPVVTPEAEVVGVHYAGYAETDQHWAISRDDVEAILPDLLDGVDVASIGVNGTAVASDEITGIWVSSVKPGSPADEVGVLPGDIITRLDRIDLAVDGTMREYCDVLRSHAVDDVLPIEIVRFDTAEILGGQLNGPALELVTSFADELDDDVVDQPAGDVTYVEVTDETGALTVEVPDSWSDSRGLPWDLDDEAPGAAGTTIVAAPSIDDFLATWSTPGMFFGASASLASILDYDGMLDSSTFEDECTYAGRDDYDDGLYVGRYDVYTDCGNDGALFVVVAAGPSDGSFMVYVQVQAITDADLEALDHILATFEVVGELP